MVLWNIQLATIVCRSWSALVKTSAPLAKDIINAADRIT
jgi:hypothetical protein